MGIAIEGNTLHAEYAHLNRLITFAYKIDDFQISGAPAWAANGNILGDDLFQVVAKAPAGETPSTEQFRLMLQALLADRFQLRIHHVTRLVAAFNLVVDKGGSKLRETAGGNTGMDEHRVDKVGLRMNAVNVTIQRVMGILSFYAHRPLIDKTGLTGHYDFTVKWLLDPLAPDSAASDLSPLPVALRDQLGLRLEPTTAPYDMIVIDHAEKPSDN